MVVMVVGSVLALDLAHPSRGLSLTGAFQVIVLQPDILVIVLWCQRGCWALYWTEVHNRLRREDRCVMRLERVKLEVVVFTQINFSKSPKICTTHNETAFCLKTDIRSHLLKAQMLKKLTRRNKNLSHNLKLLDFTSNSVSEQRKGGGGDTGSVAFYSFPKRVHRTLQRM